MKFLADMGLARRTTVYLRALGHHAVHLRDQSLQGMSDEKIVEQAQAEGRVILTHDPDREAHPSQGANHEEQGVQHHTARPAEDQPMGFHKHPCSRRFRATVDSR